MSPRACEEIRALLPAHLDGELDRDTAAGVGAHLEGCRACREELETLQLAVEALRRLPDLPAPASILNGVRARLRPVPWHRRLLAGRSWLAGVPVGALATLLVVVGVALFQARYPGLRDKAGPPAVTGPGAAPEGTPRALP
ncbi:MAG TPA: anti-sigma factor, partial [bacterium]